MTEFTVGGSAVLFTTGGTAATFTVVDSSSTFNVTGGAGPAGASGTAAIPTGGTAGQVLSKIDATDYNTQWVDQSGGGITASSTDTFTNKSMSGATNTFTSIPQSAVTSLTSDLALKAPLASPTFTGTPAGPTAAADTNTTQVATTAFVLAQAGTALPIVDSSAAAGTATRWSRVDHVHPSDTTRIANALMDAKGDLIAATAADTPARLPIGVTTGHVLTVDPAEATGMKWAATTAGAGTVVLTGDVTGTADGGGTVITDISNTAVVAASYGAAGSVATFTVAGDGRLTAAASTAIAITESQVTGLVTDLAAKVPLSVFTGKGVIAVGTATSLATGLAVGTDSHVLTLDSSTATGVKWAAASGAGIPATTVDAKGDLIAATAADTVTRLPIGVTNGHVLTVDSAEATGMKWAAASGSASSSAGGDLYLAANYY